MGQQVHCYTIQLMKLKLIGRYINSYVSINEIKILLRSQFVINHEIISMLIMCNYKYFLQLDLM